MEKEPFLPQSSAKKPDLTFFQKVCKFVRTSPLLLALAVAPEQECPGNNDAGVPPPQYDNYPDRELDKVNNKRSKSNKPEKKKEDPHYYDPPPPAPTKDEKKKKKEDPEIFKAEETQIDMELDRVSDVVLPIVKSSPPASKAPKVEKKKKKAFTPPDKYQPYIGPEIIKV